MGERRLTLPDDASGRLDAMLSRMLPAVSRRRLKAAFTQGRVLAGGRHVRGADAATPGAEVVLVDLDDALRPAPSPGLDLQVVLADDALVVVDKPAGVPAYPLSPDEPGSVAGAVLARFPDLESVGDIPLAPGLCHRLDVETSGLLVFARTASDFESMRRAFETRTIGKTYLAIVEGALEGQGEIDAPLTRRKGKHKRMIVARGARGETRAFPALTRWRALDPAPGGTRVEIELVTGVTHQARVHMAHTGHPILGDALYGGPSAPRLMLHAAQLSLAHPRTGERIELTSRLTLP